MVKSIVTTISKTTSAHLGTCPLPPALPSPAEGSQHSQQHPTHTAVVPAVPIIMSTCCRKRRAALLSPFSLSQSYQDSPIDWMAVEELTF